MSTALTPCTAFFGLVPPIYWAHTELDVILLLVPLSQNKHWVWAIGLWGWSHSNSLSFSGWDPNFLFVMNKVLIKKKHSSALSALELFALEVTAPRAWQDTWRTGCCESAVGPLCHGYPHQLQTQGGTPAQRSPGLCSCSISAKIPAGKELIKSMADKAAQQRAISRKTWWFINKCTITLSI